MTEPTTGTSRLSPWWRRATILVMIGGFSVLTLVTVLTYTNAPPIPARVVDAAGGVLLDRQTILRGQEAFLKYGLMEHGSLWGHGAYLGPDYTADYLHRAALVVRDRYGGERSDIARTRTIEDFRTNRYSKETKTLGLTSAQAFAFDRLREHYAKFFGTESSANGLRREAITSPEHIRQLTAYFAWSAWAASAAVPCTGRPSGTPASTSPAASTPSAGHVHSAPPFYVLDSRGSSGWPGAVRGRLWPSRTACAAV